MTLLSETVREAIRSKLLDMHVCLPGKVASYDLTKKVADVDLVVRRGIPSSDGDGYVINAFPQLRNIPVCQPAAGGFFVHLPVAVGDFVWVHVSDVSIDKYRSTGKLSDVNDPRLHHLAHAWCTPMYDVASVPGGGHASNLVIGEEGGAEIHIEPGGAVRILGDLEVTGEVTAKADSASVGLSTHLHPTAMGPSGAPTSGT